MGMGSCARSSASGELEQALAKEEKLTDNQPSAKSDTLPEERFEEEKQREQADMNVHAENSGKEDALESDTPKEFFDDRGGKAYVKLRKGVYAYRERTPGSDSGLSVVRIDFFDDANKLIGQFNTVENNPYNKHTVPLLEDENYQGYVYRDFVPKEMTVGNSEYKPTSYYTYIQLSGKRSMPVVGYHLLAGLDGRGVVDWKFTAICLDEKGNVLRKFEDLDIDPYTFCLSENKKFFCVAYGGLRGENLTRLRNNGFRIYEIDSGQLVYEMEMDREHTIYGPVVSSITGFVTASSTGNDFSNDLDDTFYIIDSERRRIFIKTLSYEEQKMIRGADEKGFIMKDPKTGREWKWLYEEDFAVEKF